MTPREAQLYHDAAVDRLNSLPANCGLDEHAKVVEEVRDAWRVLQGLVRRRMPYPLLDDLLRGRVSLRALVDDRGPRWIFSNKVNNDPPF
jgi:hypothetical protein